LTAGEVHSLLVQLLGIVVAFLWSFLTSLALFLGIKYTVGLRVDPETELRGLDITEHGLLAYPEQFVIETGPTEVVGNLGK
ncbi:MAG: ammonium transporter, partial [Thermogutta sp.]|nr:ammonium transporter [Thermogutta sp.]